MQKEEMNKIEEITKQVSKMQSSYETLFKDTIAKFSDFPLSIPSVILERLLSLKRGIMALQETKTSLETSPTLFD